MEFKFCKGDRIFIVLKNGTSFEGDVRNFNKAAERVSLKNVVQYPGNISIEGYRNFDSHEINQIKFVEIPDCKTGASVDGKDGSSRNPNLSMKISDAEYNSIIDLQNSYRYINNVSNDFYTAISLLQNTEAIGLYVQDTRKGRTERASVITIATRSHIFIFDLEGVGDRMLDKGLRDILQSSSIKKIVHDCRLVSDCLYHKHVTYIENVRDVEAEDIINIHQERGYIRRNSRSFSYLVECYLGIPSEVVDNSHITESWKKRPLSLQHKNHLVTYASFLIPLHTAIQNRYLQRLVDASKIYNEYIRDSDMLTFVTEGDKYVLKNPFIDLVKTKRTCRTVRTEDMPQLKNIQK